MSEQAPIFSIITPVFNGEKYIEETILSVLRSASNYSFEYIVINDGSTDGTLRILEKYSKEIRIYTQANRGESESVNLGISKSRGEFLLIVSADDPLLSGELFEGAAEMFCSESNLVAIYPDWQEIDENGEILETHSLPDFSLNTFLGLNMVLPGPGTIFTKAAAITIGGRRKKWKFVGDYDFWLRLSDKGEIRHRAKVLAQWRMHPNSTSVSSRGLDMARERIEVISSYFEESPQSYGKNLKRKSLSNAYALAARLIFFSTEVSGKKFLAKSFLLRRGWPERLSFFEFAYILTHPISLVLVAPFRRFIKL